MQHVTNARTALGYLRTATTCLHDDLESDLQVVARLRSPRERTALIEGYNQMQRCAAAAMAPWWATIPGLDDLARAASPQRHAAGTCPAAPILDDPAEALGFHYVMVGSALGGRVILRELEGAGVDTESLAFLNPYGARTGEIWHDLRQMLERSLAGDAVALDQAATGARKGYALARACLSP
jgi:heme oxygenase